MVGKDDKRFAITWKIKNFSYCWHRERQTIESPEFYAENVRQTKWILKISQEDALLSHFTVLIKRDAEDCGPASVKLNLKLCLISNKGFTLRREWVENIEFYKGKEKGFQTLLERAALFATRKDEYLPQDTLTVHCQFWEVYTTTTETKCVSALSEMELDRKLFLCTVCDFSQLHPGDSSEVQLQMLSSEDESSMFIPDHAYLSVMERTDYQEKLKLRIFFNDEIREFFSCKISVLDVDGQKLNGGKFDFRYGEYGPRILQCVLLPTKWDLMAKESLYLPVDTLTLHCELIIAAGIVSQMMKVAHLREDDRNFDEECSSSSALDDFKNIYNEGLLCDVNLQTDAESFAAHKVILSARSPVFKAMFVNDMLESVTNRIELPDMDAGTVRRLLLYMYSDAVECLEWDSVRNLYAAADKYAIGSLKTKCSTILKGILMPTQACELLVLADMHRDNDLKKFAQDFISDNDEYILGSDIWMELEQKKPQLAVEAMRHLYTCLRTQIESRTLSYGEC
ncbi:TD and POZ domain-containing protein 3 [Caerostris darwini]|uniref:TD and POZ domain-containing protein 3 n=1 Tax=Caerostris darwini TaxID=1538125 RepID=A0AAV4NLU7_9ARAC|nr:TD and POZ domain-containing protein 3 [Caerostris darwini]